MDAPEVRAATPADVGPLSRALAAAFEDDPIFGWLLPDAARRYERLVRFFALEVGDVILPSGKAWMSGDGGAPASSCRPANGGCR